MGKGESLIRGRNILGLVLIGFLGFSGCGTKEVAPFKDGLSFQYKTTIFGPMGEGSDLLAQVRFAQDPEGKGWKVLFRLSGLSMPGAAPDSGTVAEIFVDPYGRTKEGKLLVFPGPDEAPLWVPPGQRRAGGRVPHARFEKKIRWQKWEVWVAHPDLPAGSADWYYEATSGFLVGSTFSVLGAGMNTVLVETNAEGL
jgi:hypothetical protein